jgi:hypothetical protein
MVVQSLEKNVPNVINRLDRETPSTALIDIGGRRASHAGR